MSLTWSCGSGRVCCPMISALSRERCGQKPKERVCKEVGLLWQIWHSAWPSINGAPKLAEILTSDTMPSIFNIQKNRCFIDSRSASPPEVDHSYQKCPSPGQRSAKPLADSHAKIRHFSDNISRKFNTVKRIWLEVRTVVLWSL